MNEEQRPAESPESRQEPQGVLHAGEVMGSSMPAEQKKEEPKTLRGRPKRRRPDNPFDEALAFISVAIQHMERLGTPLTLNTLNQLPTLYRNFCANTGLRGQQKKTVWGIVKRHMIDAGKAVKSRDEDL